MIDTIVVIFVIKIILVINLYGITTENFIIIMFPIIFQLFPIIFQLFPIIKIHVNIVIKYIVLLKIDGNINKNVKKLKLLMIKLKI